MIPDNIIKSNKKLWDNKVQHHIKSEFYEMKAFINGKNSLNKIELEGLGDVTNKSVLHLQCHFGQDSMSLKRMGASRVLGVDFSTEAIKAARKIAKKINQEVEFLESDIYKLDNKLNEKFDIVFASYGAIVWLNDLNKYASIVKSFLKPGGIYFLAEFHPTLYLFDFDTHKISYSYFNHGEPIKEITKGTYADKNAKIQGEEYFWQHSLSETLSAFLKAGMKLENFEEFDYSPYGCFPNMIKNSERNYKYDPFGYNLPHVFTIRMRA